MAVIDSITYREKFLQALDKMNVDYEENEMF